MSQLLDCAPYGSRQDERFLAEMSELTRWHLQGCAEYAGVWPSWKGAESVDELPWLHVGIFKRVALRTQGEGVRHQRTLTSSSTTSGSPSRIALDERSSQLQGRSTLSILKDFVGTAERPLVILDQAQSLRQRGEVSARIVAAMSLRPLASEMLFAIQDGPTLDGLKWEAVLEVLCQHEELLVYGFTWILWQAWGNSSKPSEVVEALRGKTIHFVHSGGWKKLEESKVSRERFDSALLEGLAAGSRVVDYYGLVEQVGVIYPLCDNGFRHVPVWADAVVRDPYTLRPIVGEPGMLQLLNVLAWGAPYQSVLTEDVAVLVPGDCPCGRTGRRFELLGRIPKAEVRGCANV